MNNLNTRTLKYPAHNINRRIMAIKEARGGDKSQGNSGFLLMAGT
jgi:hypothetical protein